MMSAAAVGDVEMLKWLLEKDPTLLPLTDKV